MAARVVPWPSSISNLKRGVTDLNVIVPFVIWLPRYQPRICSTHIYFSRNHEIKAIYRYCCESREEPRLQQRIPIVEVGSGSQRVPKGNPYGTPCWKIWADSTEAAPFWSAPDLHTCGIKQPC